MTFHLPTVLSNYHQYLIQFSVHITGIDIEEKIDKISIVYHTHQLYQL